MPDPRLDRLVTSPAGAGATLLALDAAYRAALAQTSLAVVRTLAGYWVSVDPDAIAATSTEWLSQSVRRVLAGQKDAQRLADLYATRVRQLAVPSAPLFTPPPPAPPNEEQVRKSLIFTGPATAARDIARAQAVHNNAVLSDDITREDRESEGRSLEAVKQRIMSDAIGRASGAATRHVTTAGRDQTENFVRTDVLARGWVRTTKANCCYYCAMLASRGPVYKEDSFKQSNAKFKNHPFDGPSDQKVHDNCGCGLRPFYGMGEELPERTEEFEQMWVDFTEGYSMDAAILAFRRGYEGRSNRPGNAQ